MEPMTASVLRDRILAAAVARGWTYLELSKRSGVSAPQVYRYWHGTRGLNVDTTLQLMAAVGMKVTTDRKER